MDLTPSEYQAVKLLCEGKSAKMIGDELHRSKRTVEKQLADARAKWNCNNVADLVRTFILQLDEPRKFFKVACLLLIQGIALINVNDAQVRVFRTRTPVKTVKTARKHG